MIAQIVLTDHKYEKTLSDFLEKMCITYKFSRDFTSYTEDALKVRPDLFFIQADNNSSPDVLNLVSNIRNLFGAISTIIILGNTMSHKKMADFLSEGADQFFSFPFDLTLIEDFLSKRAQISSFNTLKYRNIPSRSTEIDINFDVNLKTLSEIGITIISKHLIKKGTLFNLNLQALSTALPYEVQALATHSIQLESKEFEIYAIFFEISDKVKNAIAHELRNTSCVTT